MKKFILVLVALGLLAVPTTVLAGPIPYPNVGTLNPATYTFTATATGDLVAYFFGSSASYGSDIGLIVDNLSQGIYGLENHTSFYGQPLVLSIPGAVHAGDVLEFQLRVNTTGGDPVSSVTYSLYSTPGLNSDGLQHIYSTSWAGDGTIPAGTYIAFEDIVPATAGDMDYNDHQFVFTNVGVGVPDGGSTLALLGAALAGIGLIRRRLS
jgi:hypothetical protein